MQVIRAKKGTILERIRTIAAESESISTRFSRASHDINKPIANGVPDQVGVTIH